MYGYVCNSVRPNPLYDILLYSARESSNSYEEWICKGPLQGLVGDTEGEHTLSEPHNRVVTQLG